MSLVLCKFDRRSVSGINVQEMLIISVSEDGMQRQSASMYTYLYLKWNLTSNINVYILIRSNKVQQYAGIYLMQVYSTCFGRPSRPS